MEEGGLHEHYWDLLLRRERRGVGPTTGNVTTYLKHIFIMADFKHKGCSNRGFSITHLVSTVTNILTILVHLYPALPLLLEYFKRNPRYIIFYVLCLYIECILYAWSLSQREKLFQGQRD